MADDTGSGAPYLRSLSPGSSNVGGEGWGEGARLHKKHDIGQRPT